MSTTKIYQLSYELSHQNGRSIVFTKQNDSVLTEDNLHAVQLKMMQSTQIPHVLSLAVENIDLKTKLHYNITNQNKVLSYFRNHTTTMSDYYQFLLSIIKTIETSSSYMLDQDNFILNTDFIFVGDNPSDVYLTYLPLTNIDKEISLMDEMKQILTDVASEVEGLQGNEFKSILNYIKNPSFSLSGLKKLVLELISLRSNINQVSPRPQSQNDPALSMNQHGSDQFNQRQMNNHQATGHDDTEHNGDVPQTKTKVKKKLPPLTSREGTYLIVAAMLFIGITWKLYDINRTSTMMTVSSSLTVIILVAALVYWKFWRPGVKPIVTEEIVKETKTKAKQKNKQQTEKQTNEQGLSQHQKINQVAQMAENHPSFSQDTHGSGQNQPFNPVQQRTESPYVNEAQSFNPAAFTTGQSAATSSMDTVLLDQFSEDTVLLEDEEDVNLGQEEQREIVPVLVKLDPTGQEEQVMINQPNFLIGRNTDAVNYTEDTIGVSRIHAEIVKIDQTNYALKDLGSKNGSKLNGERIVPYKVYALNEDDQIELGKATYTFKWSQSE